MTNKTVMVVIGTRPEAIKMAPVILEMQQAGNGLAPLVCVTGQHRQMLDQVVTWFGIKPDCDLDLMQKDQALAEFAGRALVSLGNVLKEKKADAVLVQGDTTTAMIGALAAFYERIPVGHVEAGLRTRDVYNPFPEEMNRRVAAVVAKYHFAPTQGSAEALIAEQIDPKQVFVVGNTVIDALRLTTGRKVDLGPDCSPTEKRRMILVTAHRRESFGPPFESMCKAIRAIADRHEDVEILYPVHLNPNVRDYVARYLSGHSRIRLIEPLRYEQFVHVMSNCYLILTDSGGIQEEATALGKPTLVMRDTTERPEAVSAGTAALVGTDAERITAAADRLLRDADAYRSMSSPKSPFGDGYASKRIVEILRRDLLGSVEAA